MRSLLLTAVFLIFCIASATADNAEPVPGNTPGPIDSRQVVAAPPIYTNTGIDLAPVVQDYIDLYSTDQGLDYIERSLERGRPYRDFIISILEAYRLPRELYYLALIESNFDARAVSRSGAAGIWQFMENSVEDWMTINAWVDERRDFYRSTIAAAEKLARNFTVLEDWLLAIAAYNAGLGHIERAVQAQGTRDFWELAESGALPEQTVDYVPKFLAITWIAEQAGRHGLTTSWEPPLEWTRIEVPGGMHFETIALHMALDSAVLHSWNVHLNEPGIPQGVPSYYLNIPESYSDCVLGALETLPDYQQLFEQRFSDRD